VSVVQTQSDGDGPLAASISTMVVGVLREHTGRGPEKARTHISDGLISVVVRGTLTRAEHTLIDGGRSDVVVRSRQALQEIMRVDLVSGIEALTGRTVIAFFSDSSLDADLAVESFLLAPLAATTGKS
jgi:uncharacterized protein YbcI